MMGRINEILDNVSEYQFNLALEGLFVRGGVSVGEFYINEDIVFGPALWMHIILRVI